MVEFTDQQARDALMLNGLNWHYSEIASELNQRYGTSYTKRQVGRLIRDFESESREGDPVAVFMEVVAHGAVADLFDL